MNESRFKLNVPKCLICHKNFDLHYHIPRVIPKCGHTFCQKCIKNKMASKSGRMIFACTECQSEVIIRRSVNDQLPRNITIVELLKQGQKASVEEQPSSNEKTYACPTHHKTMDMFCLTCKSIRICASCALFGAHKGHEIANEETATSQDISEVNQFMQIVSETINLMVLPDSPENLENKAKEDLAKGLKQYIRENFKQYYEAIKKKQQQLLSQCEQISLSGTTEHKIDEILQNFDLIKIKCKDLKQGMSRAQIQGILDEAKNLHNSIEQVVFQYHESILRYLEKARLKIQPTIFLQIRPVEPRRLSSMLNEDISDDNLLEFQDHQLVKKIDSPVTQKKLSNSSTHKNIENPKSEKQKEPSRRSIIRDPAQIQNQKTLLNQKKKPAPLNIPDRKAMTSKTQHNVKSQIHESDPAQVDSTAKSLKRETVSQHKKKEVSIKKKSPPKEKGKDETFKCIVPNKQMNYELRTRLQATISEIDRQESGGSLELISMEIDDQLILHICEYLKNKKLKYSMVKLVKNNLTDEGMKILLSYLILDNYVKVLNLTSNHLTNKTLELIRQFIQRNIILKTIYLSHNKITPMQLKRMQPEFEAKFVQVIL